LDRSGGAHPTGNFDGIMARDHRGHARHLTVDIGFERRGAASDNDLRTGPLAVQPADVSPCVRVRLVRYGAGIDHYDVCT